MKRFLAGVRRSWVSTLVLGVLMLSASVEGAPGDDKLDKKDKTEKLPAFVEKIPEGVADLKAMQKQVKRVLETAMPATVGILVPEPGGFGMASGSGVIVSKEGYVLTAGHISQKPDRNCVVVLSSGRQVKAKTLGWFRSRDAGMVKIIDKGDWPTAEMGDSAALKRGQWCLTIGHPGGYKKGRAPVVRLGRILMTNQMWVQTDCPLVGGDSGGPLFDLQGKVIGIHSWISQSISMNMHVPVNTYKDRNWKRLIAGEAWGGSAERMTLAYLGVSFDRDKDDLVITAVYPRTGAASAGLKAGDVVTSIDGVKLETRDDLAQFLVKKKPGDEIALVVRRDGKPVKAKLTLGKRPEE